VFTNIKTPLQFFGIGLFLVLVYLLVTNADGVKKISTSFWQGINGTYRTLQGRNASFG